MGTTTPESFSSCIKISEESILRPIRQMRKLKLKVKKKIVYLL